LDQIENVLNVLRKMKKKSNGPLPLRAIFKSLIDERICDSSKTVSECLRSLNKMGKIRTLNTGVDIELLEEIKAKYVQASLPFRRR